MTRVYYREAMGAFIVFDVTRPASFEAVAKWKEDLDSKLTLANGKNVATVLLANKCDQGRDVLTNNGIKMEQFCQDNGFVGWYETSAKVSTTEHSHQVLYHPDGISRHFEGACFQITGTDFQAVVKHFSFGSVLIYFFLSRVTLEDFPLSCPSIVCIVGAKSL